MRRYRPRCVGSQEQRGKGVYGISARVQIPATGGRHTIEVDVRKECSQEEASPGYRNGSRVEVRGTMYLKRRGDKLYFNLFADEICNAATDDADCVKGELAFRGKVGQNIEEKKG